MRSSRLMKRLRRWFICSAIFGCFAVTGYALFLSAGFFLDAPAVRPEKADAIISLGGDQGGRQLRALELFKEGFARDVLIIKPVREKTRQQDFIRAGAKPENILFFDSVSKNSYDEAHNAMVLVKSRGWKHILILTDPPHIRRAGWIWARVLKDSGIRITPVATSPPWWNAPYWWKNKISRDFVISEYKKMVYYGIVYGLMGKA